MAGLSERDVARLREALRAGVLDAAVQRAPAAVRPLFERLRAALQSADPQAEFEAIAGAFAANPDLKQQVAMLLVESAADAARATGGLRGAVDALKGSAAQAESARRALLDALARGEVEGLDEADARALRAVLDQARVGPLAASLGKLLGQADEVAAVVTATIGDLAKPEDVEAVMAPLRETVERLEGEVDTEGARQWATALRDLSGRLRAVAAARGLPRTSHVAWVEAAMAEADGMARGADPADAEPFWHVALEAAEAAGDVGVAARAAGRLQAAAIDARDFEAVIALSRRVQAVALARGDVRRDLFCRLEQAQALSQTGRHDEAEVLLATALVGARREGSVDLVGRAYLAQGDALMARDESDEARRAYESAIATLGDAPGHAPIAARAALGLARSLANAPDQAARRTRALELALDFGKALGDPRLATPARLGLAEDAADRGDLGVAVGHLARGRDDALALGAPIDAFTETLGRLEERYGADAVAAALRADRQR